MKELINDPHAFWQMILVASAAIPVIAIFIRWFWAKSKGEVKNSIILEMKDDNEVFKELMQDQITVSKDQMAVVREIVMVVKRDNEISQEQNKANHEQTKQMYEIMMLHIDELTHIKGKVENHEMRIFNIELKKTS